MTTNQFNKLLSEPWKYNDKEMTYYSYNLYTKKKDKKKGNFRGFTPMIFPDGTVRVELICLANYGIKAIHYSDVVLPKPLYL